MTKVVSALVSLLALGVGSLHFALDFVLFRGNFFGFPPPPPGAPRPAPPPGPPPSAIAQLIGSRLPQLFLANLIVYLVLAILFVAVSRARLAVRVVVDVLIALVTIATLVGWNGIGRPNPMGLGTWAVSMEIALIVFALLHLVSLYRRPAPARS
ncbi:MAG TPA: hypothetical protein VK457_04080 [Chloroflexota bacterium]|nr:hypothetical protein [Chloroflexota bacterium]